MANVENDIGEFTDLGNFKSKKCLKVIGKMVCEMKFTKGKLTMTELELNKICKK